MASDCAGRHVCEPDYWPTALGQAWTCPECGAKHYAFDVHAAYSGNPEHDRMLKHVNPGTLGWTTTGPAGAGSEGDA